MILFHVICPRGSGSYRPKVCLRFVVYLFFWDNTMGFYWEHGNGVSWTEDISFLMNTRNTSWAPEEAGFLSGTKIVNTA